MRCSCALDSALRHNVFVAVQKDGANVNRGAFSKSGGGRHEPKRFPIVPGLLDRLSYKRVALVALCNTQSTVHHLLLVS